MKTIGTKLVEILATSIIVVSSLWAAAWVGYPHTPSVPCVRKVTDDDAITARIINACRSNLPQDAVMDVETSNGVVKLTGFAASENAARQAVTIAAQMPGVVRVEAT